MDDKYTWIEVFDEDEEVEEEVEQDEPVAIEKVDVEEVIAEPVAEEVIAEPQVMVSVDESVKMVEEPKATNSSLAGAPQTLVKWKQIRNEKKQIARKYLGGTPRY